MKNASARIVLGFFSAGAGDPENALRSLPRSAHPRLFRAGGGEAPAGERYARYSRLRLSGESLVIAQAAPEAVQAVVQIFRASGSPAVFAIREDFSQASAPEPDREAHTPRLLARLRESERQFDQASADLEQALRLDHSLTAAAEWILDNGYLVLTHVAEIRRHLPRHSRILASPKNGCTHLWKLAQDLAARTDCALTATNITESLRAYQATAEFPMAEMWVFPLLLRMALIEALTSLAIEVSRSQQLREAAYLWANRLVSGARQASDEFDRMLACMEADPIAAETHFAVALAEQLQGEEDTLARVQRWIEHRHHRALTILVQTEHNREASERVSTANAFGSLRVLSRLDFAEVFESVSLVEAELRRDPAGIYPRCDFATRDQCRHVVEQVARHSGVSELDVARRSIELARGAQDGVRGHAAYYLLSSGLAQLEAECRTRVPFRTRLIRAVRRHATPGYLAAIVVLTVCFTALSLAIASDAGVHRHWVLAVLGTLALFPLSELAIQIVNALVVSLLAPGKLPKMYFPDGIPAEDATLVVVPMMLSSVEAARHQVEKLEVRFLANRDANLFFSLFSDFTDSPEQTAPGDAALLDAAREGIADLNQRYGERFLLFHRARLWSPDQRKWIGRERKRGKIEELNAFLCGEGHPEILQAGKLPVAIRYAITLDADTQLPPGAARRLVETIAHPLNRVDLDPLTRTRRQGYAIVQPRVTIALPDATATRFTRVFAHSSGTDPYCNAVSDAHQDLFAEAMFHGKAIYEVRSFCSVLNGRFPPETLLSHDLIEGAYAGVGLASDIELFENLPHDYASFSRRQHRWIRGDWQIARWMFPRVPTGTPGSHEPNPLTILNRWRIFDNLRRSLAPVAALVLLLFGWLISAAPGVWSVVVGLAVAIPAVAPLLDRWARRVHGSVYSWQGAFGESIRATVMVAFLPHQAWLSVDAIARALYRSTISRRRLLDWETAESASASAHHIGSTLRQMLAIGGLSLALLIFLHTRGEFLPSFVFLILWIVSPALMLWLARPSAPELSLDRRATRFLRSRARLTWRYFDDLVGPESHWLPPDNSQLALRVEVAGRTSPTNIGLWLTSALAARDFGYLTVDGLAQRCTNTFTTLDRLERYEGHFLNWYNTHTLEPLSPRYVSTVDSGNLLASLWAIEHGCHDAAHAPLIGPTCLRGLADTLAILRQFPHGPLSLPLAELRRLVHGKAEGHEIAVRLRLAAIAAQEWIEARPWSSEPGDERSYWASRLSAEIASWTSIAGRYLRWMDTLADPTEAFLRGLGGDSIQLRRRALRTAPSLATLASRASTDVDSLLALGDSTKLAAEHRAWLNRLASEYAEAQSHAAETLKEIETISANAGRIAGAIDMRFLYDAGRRLFAVGYAVGGPVEFTSHYDLLASECRLASLAAIAKGDAPVEHWLALGRPRAPSARGPVLLSWSGTMFEYLMPLLLLRTVSGSLLDRACREAVQRQIEFGRERGLPWGLSECAYSALDQNQIYQYRAFGVPELALKRGLEDERVIAPYATVLALMVDPTAAIENLKRLESLGLSGPMGFYEAIDFTRERKPGHPGVVIYTYMAHHQGMSLIALDNVLHHGAMRRRFHGDPRVRAFESLLFERVSIARAAWDQTQARHTPVREPVTSEPAERTWSEDTLVPRVHLAGNGRYSLMLTNSGGGYSRWNDFDVTRWRSDIALDPWGGFLYIRDVRARTIWAAAHNPVGGHLGTSAATFSPDRAEFQRRVSGIETTLHIAAAAEDDIELRRLTVLNRTLRSREIEFTSFVELALAPHRADTGHPAFSKLFIETEYIGGGALIARRRPRSPDEPQVWAAHVLIGAVSEIQYETDRAKFLGRAKTPAEAEALERDLTGSTGAVLDPVFSLRCRVAMEPRERLELSFLTMAAPSREALLDLIEKYRRPEAVSRSFEMAWTRAQLKLRYLGLRPDDVHRFQALAGQLIYPGATLRPAPSRLARNRLGQTALWAYGISGDLPMLVVTVADAHGVALARELVLAHAYWRMLGFHADLIILNQESASYDQPLRQQLLRQIEAHSRDCIDRPGGVFLRDWNAIPEEHRDLIFAAASAVLSGSRGPLEQQLATPVEPAPPPPFVATNVGREEPSRPLPFLELPYFNGLGGFTKDGREYAIYLGEASTTPMPWVNVIANPAFGAMVSESGLGYTWSENSQTNRLTPWHNDPLSDPQSEAIYIRDDDSGTAWTPTPLPVREKDAYRARHGQGYTVFEHNSHAIGQELTVFVPENEPVKVYRLRLRNESSRTRKLSVFYFAEWVLGSVREQQQLHIRTSFDKESGALLAGQTWTGTAGRIAFAAAIPRAASWSGDRASFLARNGSRAKPAALGRASLDGRTGPGLDPAAALQGSVTIEPGQQAQIVFLLGEAGSRDAVRQIVSGIDVDRALESAQRRWDSTLGALQVRTPVLSVDMLLNRWLMYQVLSCRFWGRSALYQSSGAFGFRDQLQDSLAFVYAAPCLTRQHILASAARQFAEGDVQHWWHPDSGMGVRTRCSDDMLWLPYVAAQYIAVTGDDAILDEPVAFVEGAALTGSEQERMFVPAVSAQTAPLWDHCRRAIDRASHSGAHGLPLIGSGDWNDGLNRVGIEGRGESVWLAWFLCATLQAFARAMNQRDPALAGSWIERTADIAAAVEKSSWDGEWYLRGFFDDGSPLGSRRNDEARIDSIAQSWAVICGAADPNRARTAMESAGRILVDEHDAIVKLFAPPFDHSTPHPGYIMGYPPGVRENGGQYTHGSLWMAMAQARMGDGGGAVRLLQTMNPIEHARDPESTERYGGEPYVTAADVSSSPGRSGHSGWTWYTGSAAWMYRIWIEEVLGFRLRGDTLTVDPAIPADWPGFEIDYRYRSTLYRIEIRRSDAPANQIVRLVDDGATHNLVVEIPRAAQKRIESAPTRPVPEPKPKPAPEPKPAGRNGMQGALQGKSPVKKK